MKKLLFILTTLIAISNSFPQGFFRALPDSGLLSNITTSNFPNMDAVIILKEQSINYDKAAMIRRGGAFSAPSVTTTNIRTIKLFNEAAVKRYGTVELAYSDNDGYSGSLARARVLKQSGKIETLDEKEIRTVAILSAPDGTPLISKIMFTVPNLIPGDVLQYETQVLEMLLFEKGGIFYFNDKDYVLISNLNITSEEGQAFNIYSFPEEIIGLPNVKQVETSTGTGVTRFWSVKNLSSILDEPYSLAFADLSMMTCMVNKIDSRYDISSWKKLLKRYYEDYLDAGKAGASDCEKLGIPEENNVSSFASIDSLYNQIKSHFKINTQSSVFPNSDISALIKTKKGNASDLSFIMKKVLTRWDVPCDVLLIRDRRDGAWEKSVPTLNWFNRIGLLVTINGLEKFYDFDRSIQNNYENPWFLNNVDAYAIKEGIGTVKKLEFNTKPADNYVLEEHLVNINNDKTMRGSVIISYKGCMADKLRGIYYEAENHEVKDVYEKELLKNSFSDLDAVLTNDFYNNSICEVSASGKLKNNAEEVDTFLVVKGSNVIFSQFRNELYTASRKKGIVFPAQMKYKYVKKIKIPEGYVLKSSLVNKSVNSAFNGTINIESNLADGAIRISTELIFNNNIIDLKYYKDVISFIDKAINEIGKDVVFKKK